MNQINSTKKNVLSIIFFTLILNFILLISAGYPWAYFARETTDTSKQLLKADKIKQINWEEQNKKISAQIPNRSNRPVKDDYVPNELVIKYKKNIDNTQINLKEAKESLKVTKISKHLGFRVVKIPKGKTVKDLVAKFSKDPDVEYAEPNYYFSINYFPDDLYLNDVKTTAMQPPQFYMDPITGDVPTWTDPATGQQFKYYTYLPYTLYGMRLPSLPQNYTGYISDTGAWEIYRGSSGVKVAVIDTGVMGNHEDLLGKVRRGFDYVNNDGMPLDDHGHGTHVAGIIAAKTDNLRGVCGFAPSATIIPIKVLSASGAGSSADVAEGIIGSVKDYNANILNLSLGGAGDAQVIRLAIQEVLAEGAIVVAAAGNDGLDFTATPMYPAAYPRVITVGSFNYRGSYNYLMQTTGTGTPIPTSYSNYGYITGRTNATDFGVEIYAPGGDPELYPIFSTYPYGLGGTKYAGMMGTSMACPQVAGLCALLYSQGIRSNEIMTYALWSTSQSPYPPYAHGSATFDFGYGVIDPRYTLQYAKDLVLPLGIAFVQYTLDDDNLGGTRGNNNKL
ncbi:MAG: S8 family serine peptidase, partial [bacterium]|nr:S8 family serine peptidase [bacterium]